jgi:hypothetical protein
MEVSMAFFQFVYKHGIWISIPLFILSVILLIKSITGAIRTGRQAVLLSVPLAERQEVDLTETGNVILCMEGPYFSRRFKGLEYQLTGSDGVLVSNRPVLFKTRRSGFSKATMELRVFKILHPGRYMFQIRGLGDVKPTDAEHRMVFMRPNFARTLVFIIAIIVSSAFTILSIVLFFLRLLKG